MLAWLFRRVPRLRLVYGLPQIFDTLLLISTFVLHKERLMSLHEIERTVLSWPGVTTKPHRFGGTEFTRGRREIGHLHSHGLLDIPFTRDLRDAAIGAGQAQPHHIFPHSAWVSVWIRSEGDISNALHLLRRSYERQAAHVL